MAIAASSTRNTLRTSRPGVHIDRSSTSTRDRGASAAIAVRTTSEKSALLVSALHLDENVVHGAKLRQMFVSSFLVRIVSKRVLLLARDVRGACFSKKRGLF